MLQCHSGRMAKMPAIVEPDDWPLWLGQVEGAPARALLPQDGLELKIWPVSRRRGYGPRRVTSGRKRTPATEPEPRKDP